MAASRVTSVAKDGPQTEVEQVTKFTVERRRRETKGLYSVSRANQEMDRFTTTVPIRWANAFYIARKTS